MGNLKKIEKKYKTKTFIKISLKDSFFIPENTWHSHIQIRGQSRFNLFQHWLISKMIIFRGKMSIQRCNLKKSINIYKEIKKFNKPLTVDKVYYKSFTKKFFFYAWAIPTNIQNIDDEKILFY